MDSERAIELPLSPPVTRRRKPPFCREIESALAAGRAPNLYVFAGPEAWERATRRRFSNGPAAATLLPADTAPEAVAWPKVDALVLVADDVARADAVRIAQAIVSQGVRAVVCATHQFIVRARPPELWGGRAA